METALSHLGLAPKQVAQPPGNLGYRVVDFLLRWEQYEAALECLNELISLRPNLPSLLDDRARGARRARRSRQARGVDASCATQRRSPSRPSQGDARRSGGRSAFRGAARMAARRGRPCGVTRLLYRARRAAAAHRRTPAHHRSAIERDQGHGKQKVGAIRRGHP